MVLGLEQTLEWIIDLPDPGYVVVQHIPVDFELGMDGESIAIFKEGNIAMSGENQEDAWKSLRHDIPDTFMTLLDEEDNLTAGAKKQLDILRSYIEVH